MQSNESQKSDKDGRAPRREYREPRLTVFGNIREITQTIPGNGSADSNPAFNTRA
jgi:hypothetical protein